MITVENLTKTYGSRRAVDHRRRRFGRRLLTRACRTLTA